MSEPQLEFDRPPEFEPAEPPRSRGPIVAVVALVVLLVALAGVVWYTRQPSRAVTPAPSTSAAAPRPADAAPRTPLAPGQALDVELPRLDDSDAFVRVLVGRLSSHPALAAWLAGEGLVGRATAAVQNVASGASPARHLRALAPSGSFAVREQGARTVIDPRSYDRYTWVADGFVSLDTAGLARVYATVAPLAAEAYRELGFPDAPFDEALERAMVQVLAAPVQSGEVAVVPNGGTWAFADPRLEALPAAQKHMLRLGPDNGRRVQAKVREIAAALGIPAERLGGGTAPQ